MRIPLGVIAMIYEARPNVTADAAALCLKAGNAVILRGGSEALASNARDRRAACTRALRARGLPAAAVPLVDGHRRASTMLELLQLTDLIDLAIPRGGEGLIRFVAEHARVPVIKHYKGVCHLYVDARRRPRAGARDLLRRRQGLAARRVQRARDPAGPCATSPPRFLPRALAALRARGVELRGDDAHARFARPARRRRPTTTATPSSST